MMNKALFSTLLLTVALMVLAGCDPTLNSEGGRKVKFTAASQASPATKTAYYGTPSDGWQTISWSEGDKIRIYAPNNGSISGKPVDPAFRLDYVYADYQVTGVQNDGHLSKADLNNDAANGLIWSGSGDATFYAAYRGDVVKIATNNSNQLRFYFEIPSTQDGAAEFVKKMPMLSKQEVENGKDVHLDFYPAFSAFEFHLKSDIDDSFTVDWVELSVVSLPQPGDTYPTFQRFPLTGNCYYDLNLLPNYATDRNYPYFVKLSTGDISNGGYSIKFNVGKTISKTQEASFTFYTLPVDLAGLEFKVQCSKTVNGGTEVNTRKLKLMKNADWVSFPAGHKALITGLAVDPEIWCFQTITLQGEVLDWEVAKETTTSIDNPESSQFAITGDHIHNMYQRHNQAAAYKPYRQRWILNGTDSVATVSFKVVSPAGGTYSVLPQGDTDYYTIMAGTTEITPTAPLTGNISASTNITFTVRPKSEALNTDKKVWFTTSVTASDGTTVFNIDSETQLYDTRGYHYFMTKESQEQF